MSVDMSAEAISARIRAVAEATDLRVERRLDGKLDMRPEAVSARIRAVGQLSRLCVRLGQRPSPAETGSAASSSPSSRAEPESRRGRGGETGE